MGIAATNPEQYETAFKKLFPRGDYWDRQFSDPQSDVSLFCRIKLTEFIRFRGRMTVLRNESKPQSAEELLDDWERVLAGFVSYGLGIQQRRAELLERTSQIIARGDMQDVAKNFGFIITGILLPYRPAFFGFSRFGINRIFSPASWQVVNFSVDTQGNGDQIGKFEAFMRTVLLANYIPRFFYDGGKS
jgi:uncharacterized protein YmfQ (DUF2313 family)